MALVRDKRDQWELAEKIAQALTMDTEEAMETLLPCPFCGEPPMLDPELLGVFCDNGACVMKDMGSFINPNRWNTRASSEAVLELLEKYEQDTRALPSQHEIPEKGCSTFNWRMHVIRELRAQLASADAAHRAREEAVRELPREMTPAMWGAGRTAFEKYASRYRDARTTVQAVVIADMAPQEIWQAIYDAAAFAALTHPSHSDAGAGSGEEGK